MEIRVNEIEVAHHSLLLGCVVVGPGKSWMRFVQVKIPLHVIRADVFESLVKERQAQEPSSQHDVPLF